MSKQTKKPPKPSRKSKASKPARPTKRKAAPGPAKTTPDSRVETGSGQPVSSASSDPKALGNSSPEKAGRGVLVSELVSSIPKEEGQYGPPPRKGRICRLSTMPRQQYRGMLALIRLGVTNKIASAYVGVHPDTFNLWMEKGREANKGAYRRFFHDVLEASAEARGDAEMRVHFKSPLDWLKTSPASRLGPDVENWQEKQTAQLELSGPDGNPLELNLSQTLRVDQKTAKQALAELETIGFAHLTPIGRAAILGEEQPANALTDPGVIDEPTHPQPHNSNGHKRNGKP